MVNVQTRQAESEWNANHETCRLLIRCSFLGGNRCKYKRVGVHCILLKREGLREVVASANHLEAEPHQVQPW